MTTTNTVGQTVFTIRQIVDHAHRRAKVPAQLIAGEKIQFALENLWLNLMQMASQGVPVWRIQTQILPMYQGQVEVPTESGTVEILNANLRTMQRLSGTYTTSAGGDADLAFDSDLQTACTQTSANGNIKIDFGSDTTITTVGLLPNSSGTWNFVYEISQDGSIWETVDTFTAEAVSERVWIWNDYSITVFDSYEFFRIRATGGTTLDVDELYVANLPQAIPMAPLNKDDYFDLPNKTFQGRPVQYWQDLQRDKPVLMTWPVANDAANFQVIEAQCHMRIQDVGTIAQKALTLTLDVPDRWLQCIIWDLAEMIVAEDEDSKAEPDFVMAKAREARTLAWGGITNKGPLYLQPNISVYTR